MNYENSDPETKKSFSFLSEEEESNQPLRLPVQDDLAYPDSAVALAAKAKLLEAFGAKP